MTRDEVNSVINKCFLEHMPRQRKIRIHIKDEDGYFTHHYDFHYSSMSYIHELLNMNSPFVPVILEWLVNDYEKQPVRRNSYDHY